MIEEKKKEINNKLESLLYEYYEHGANTHTICTSADAKAFIEPLLTTTRKEAIDEAVKKIKEICKLNDKPDRTDQYDSGYYDAGKAIITELLKLKDKQ